MSQNASDTEWSKEMASEEHLGTYQAFLAGAKWGTVAIALLLVAMAIFLV